MFDFISKRYYFFALSLIIIISGVISFFNNGGFNLDIQFQGGTILEIQMNDDDFEVSRAEEIVRDAINKQVTAQKSHTLDARDSENRIDMLIINVSSQDTLTDEEQNIVVESLREEFDIAPNLQMTVRNVHPSIGQELRQKSMMAVFFALVLILLYIWWRFNTMSGLAAAFTAIVATIHDILIMLSIYSIFNIPLNETFIAAMLTILGYSMNDTIIIYDRIRENTGILRKLSLKALVNTSIMQTLARSINTTITLLICLVTLYAFSTMNNIGSIREFSFPLLIGIVSGAYSSIFVASPLWVMIKEYMNKKKVAT